MRGLLEALAIAGSLTAANYAWQLCTERDWLRAFERSWFQLVAVLLVWWELVR